MDLNEFIESVFINLIDGVKSAQAYAAKNNAKVAPHPSSSKTEKGNKVDITYRPVQNEIEFEIILSKTETGKNKKGVGVFLNGVGLGVEGSKGIENYENTKIKFSIPFVFPIHEE